MKRGNFLKYFLLTYFVCLAPSLTAIFPDESLPWVEKIGIGLLVPLIVTILLAPLLYWLQPKLHRRHGRKKIKKKLFQLFIEKHRFRILEDSYLLGQIDDYTVLMHAQYDDFQHSKWINIQVIFDPKRNNEYIENEFIYRMIRKYSEKDISWHINSIIIKKSYALKMPKYEIIYPLLKRCISELKASNIASISYSEWQRIIPETQDYINHQKKV
ncbi:hypothetical protein [Kordia sp.]|uniref:hypothetical protein n=1 Tax=Kordia sp. TaxID=1965332 RepID=UPI0025BD0C23|nr:hypothetical protein [Kordia sp.]MCH2194013.1 hypothetical protein [Kordia sp.]